MSDVTVKQLAEDVGIPLDRLLTQLADAKLAKSGEDDIVKEEEKLQLLTYLRASHGKGAESMARGWTAPARVRKRSH